jgi:hypothetical protein
MPISAKRFTSELSPQTVATSAHSPVLRSSSGKSVSVGTVQGPQFSARYYIGLIETESQSNLAELRPMSMAFRIYYLVIHCSIEKF